MTINALERHLPKEDRVRNQTPRISLRRLDAETRERIFRLADGSKMGISTRIEELEREWDIERYLEMNASTLALSGVALGAAFSKRWLILPGAVLAFLLQHALQGWCPPIPVFRRFGVRTRQEIEREKYALKCLRGDFGEASSPPASPEQQVPMVLKAVDFPAD